MCVCVCACVGEDGERTALGEEGEEGAKGAPRSVILFPRSTGASAGECRRGDKCRFLHENKEEKKKGSYPLTSQLPNIG